MIKTFNIYIVGQQTFAHDRKVFVGRNETVILNCTCFNQNESSWRVLKKTRVTAIDTDATDEFYIPYTHGLLLNPKLINSNIDIVGNYKSGECNLIIRHFSNYDEGTYKCEYWENGNIDIDTYHVQIRNPLVMEITYTNFEHKITIGCKSRGGEPYNYTVNYWKHYSEFYEYIRSFKGLSNGKLTISKSNSENRSHENDGIYTCQATNGMVGGNTDELALEGYILINDKVPPIFVNSNNEVQNGRFGQKINLTVISYNKFGRIQAYISKLNESLNIPANQQRIIIRELFHNVNITVSGIQVTFQIILDTNDDFTNYTIKACNMEGCNEFIVQIMLTVKRSRKFNRMLNISAQVNDREIEILNYNNDSFAQITNVAEVNNDSISDMVLRADVVSSDESSSLKQYGDGYENPYQTIDLCDIDMHQYSSATDRIITTTVYVSKGDTAILKCKVLPNSKTGWDKEIPHVKYLHIKLIPQADGQDINPYISNKDKLAVVGNITTGDYNLQIQNVASNDEGTYTCFQRAHGNIIREHRVLLKIEVKPVNVKVLHSDKGVIEGEEDKLLNLTCNVQSGIPPEIIKWYNMSSLIKSGGPGVLTISFKTKRYHHNKQYSCKVEADSLLTPKQENITLNIKYKPYVYINTANPIIVTENNNLTFLCSSDGNPFVKEMNIENQKGQVLTNCSKSTCDLKILKISQEDAGIYKCNARNIIGIAETVIKVNVTCKYMAVMVKYVQGLQICYEYGYCWILMGSIVGGTLIFCIGSQVFCLVKRAKKFNAVLQISQEHNYDEIGTLNYHNDIFDPIAHVAEVNKETVSSITETNDIISGTDVVSSNDSSSIKQVGDGYENPYTLLTLVISKCIIIAVPLMTITKTQ
ncbi:NEGR1 [Mytilus coruscus]|uniref:NEGR1 n=1 Tax=Mytilus coruscus TaxID=42192 RepID=A0A6J8CE05_MYTCO|nr:NEGR1 [Mytilus coruscus]